MRKTLRLSISCFAFLAFFSCSNDNNANQQEEINSTISTQAKTVELTPNYHNNPYDSIGIAHNIILSNVMNNANSSYTVDDYLNGVRTQVSLYYTDLPTQIPNNFFSNSDVYDIIADSDNYYSNVIESLDTDYVVKEKLSNVLNIVKNYWEGESEDYNDLKDEIIEYENSIMSNAAISSENKQIILSFTSVARHSSYYWSYEAPPSYTTLGKKWWKVVLVIGADIFGAAGGAVVGMGTGFPPVAVITGTIGAAAASGGTADLLTPN